MIKDDQLTIGMGFIGAGMIGQLAHMFCYQQISSCSLTGLAELREQLGKEVLSKQNIANYYPNHLELLKNPDINAVAVVTRRHATGQIVLDALNAGKHVLSEKPMAHTLEQSIQLVEAARKNNLIYSVGYMKRYDPGVIFARQLIREAINEGYWGDLQSVHCYSYGGNFAPGYQQGHDFLMTDENRPDGLVLWPIAPDWLEPQLHERYAWFLNVFCHDINLVRYLIDGKHQLQSANFGESTYALLMTANNINISYDFIEQDSSAWTEGIQINFKSASLLIQLPAPLDKNNTARVYVLKDGNKEALTYPDHTWAFQNQALYFIDTILNNNKNTLNSGEDSLEDMRLIEQIWRFYKG
ncbi:MAG: Gfo/Idh/MocA family oxidoreductase [Gammaproteobacteria bacterium]|nr:Gfo/Idh/MocA family oxidoreductase [Gammaproteobacteria bacterium]